MNTFPDPIIVRQAVHHLRVEENENVQQLGDAYLINGERCSAGELVEYCNDLLQAAGRLPLVAPPAPKTSSRSAAVPDPETLPPAPDGHSLAGARTVARKRALRPTGHLVRDIARHVAEGFGIDPERLLGKQRVARFAWPRQVAMYLAIELTGRTYVEVGRALGRDHTTVVHGVNQVRDRIASCRATAAMVESLRPGAEAIVAATLHSAELSAEDVQRMLHRTRSQITWLQTLQAHLESIDARA